MRSPTRSSDHVARFLLAVAAILAICHVFGASMRWWKQPVLREILSGLLRGPSALGIICREPGNGCSSRASGTA
jgi:Kef-type K+ transport system membrane component KefB